MKVAFMAEKYLYPRVCPILSVSREDLGFCTAKFGQDATVKALAKLIVQNYDFPYDEVRESDITHARNQLPETVDCKAQSLGYYRNSRLGDEIKIPGVTCVLHDTYSLPDWYSDRNFVELRMKCWVSGKGRIKQWYDDKSELRSPYARATHPETLEEILTSKPQDLLTSDALRKLALGTNELIMPNTEFYIHAIGKIYAKSVTVMRTIYLTGVVALASLSLSGDLRCRYNSTGLTQQCRENLRKFLRTTGGHVEENPKDILGDLVFIDVVPYGNHDMRPYLGEQMSPRHMSYAHHMSHFVVKPLLQLIAEPRDGVIKVGIVSSLKEFPTMPTIEPILLTLLGHRKFASHFRLVGSLVSNKKDYVIFLLLLLPKPQELTPDTDRWFNLFKESYPELFDDMFREHVFQHNQRPEKPKTLRSPPPITESEDIMSHISNITLASEIPLQGPRKFRGKLLFPTRTRKCQIVSQTHDQGSITFVFGDVIQPPEPSPESTSQPQTDPFLNKMITSMRHNMQQGSVEGSPEGGVKGIS